ncbi:MAG: response regulator [Alphaproteobacteria bacterium]|nr:response regulator [Alphaproteobacteria bacterium]|tara:strand:- start:21054 stop:21443 length:390 start_codon:yes stop_codon:yes gene_type:complete
MSSQITPARDPHIILVEDDDEVRRSMTMLLRSWGYSVEVYSSGIELLSSRHIPASDAVIIDYKMPHMDGLALLKRLRQQGLTTPAILITGFYSNSLAERAKSLGFCDVLEKPAINRLLQDKLQTTLNAA